MLIGIARKYSELRNTRSPSAHQWWACKIVIDWEVRPNGKTLGLRSWRSHILEQFPNDLSHDMLKYMQYCPTRAVTDHCYLNWLRFVYSTHTGRGYMIVQSEKVADWERILARPVSFLIIRSASYLWIELPESGQLCNVFRLPVDLV